MKIKKQSLLFVIVLATLSIYGQQDAQYTQYMYNTLSINPAYTGSRKALSFIGLHRSQWVGIEGAPATQTLNVHAPVSEKVGLGLSIINDVIGNGVNQDTYVDGAFSYTIPVSLYSHVAFGLKLGGHLLNIDFNRLKAYRPELNSGIVTVDRQLSPNFGTGIYYHSDHMYFGISVPNILKTQHFRDSNVSDSFLATERVNWYVMGGYVYEISPLLKFKPATLIKVVSGAPVQVDVSANFQLEETFTIGMAYRLDAAISGLVGFQMTQRLMLGLAYDRETTALGNAAFNSGSFEFFLRYEFINRWNRREIRRFF